MNKQILWTAAALLTTTLAIPLASQAEIVREVESTRDSQPALTSSPRAKNLPVVKVGEYKSPVKNRADGQVIARIHPHQEVGSNRQAATIYIQNLPVLTFLSAKNRVTSKTESINNQTKVKVATTETKVVNKENNLQSSNTPVWRATRVAAKLNQINLASLDAQEIAVSWKSSDRYGITVNGEELVEINTETLLPDTTKDPALDALQITNRLRRLLGNAPPLKVIAGLPEAPKPQIVKQAQQVVAQAVKVGSRGMASWYGPGFNGRRSANGERYNQNGLTAAHRSLPFGTKVKVTNVRTGRSVVVRITDRGPHVRGRIIDLSAAAARIVGVMQSGVAPVQLEVLGR